MAPEQIKERIQTAYLTAISNRNMQRYRSSSSSLDMLFREIRIYGRDSGMDFVTTNIDRIAQEAVSSAECKETSLTIPVYGSGVSATEGMKDALQELTALKVVLKNKNIELIWAEETTVLA